MFIMFWMDGPNLLVTYRLRAVSSRLRMCRISAKSSKSYAVVVTYGFGYYTEDLCGIVVIIAAVLWLDDVIVSVHNHILTRIRYNTREYSNGRIMNIICV